MTARTSPSRPTRSRSCVRGHSRRVEEHGDGGAYVRQHLDVAQLVADAVRERTGVDHPWQLVYQSRSGAPHIPWLDPDICDHLEERHAAGAPAVVMAPIGFVSDHMEVMYDLDTEARAKAEELGLPVRRSATVGADPRFAAAIRDLSLWSALPSKPGRRSRRRWCALGALGADPTTLSHRLLPGLRPPSRCCGPARQPLRATVGRPLHSELLAVAQEAARRAGALLRDSRPADLAVAATKSSPIDVVTEMDIAAEKLITDLISEHRRDDGFLGEEGASTEGTSGIRWVIDPLDGTVNYLYGLPTWAVSIAAEHDGEPVVGVVAAPAPRDLPGGPGRRCGRERQRPAPPPRPAAGPGPSRPASTTSPTSAPTRRTSPSS
ncbi:Ferrochelatase [Streptomyces alboniger]